jgi:parvulin-like peptidyl-prolyl isomerase
MKQFSPHRVLLPAVLLASTGFASLPFAPFSMAPAEAAPAAQAAATVNNESIPMADFNRMVNAVKTLDPGLNAATPEAQKALEAARDRILDNLIEQALLYQKAQERGIKPSDADVQAELKAIKQDYPTEAEFNKWLADSGKTAADLRQVIVKELAIEELFKQVTADVTVTDADIQDFYQKNIAAFTRPETASVRQIWIAARKEAPAAERAQAKARATTLAQQARSDADFGKLAFANSDDPVSKGRGGDLGIVARTSLMAKPLLDAIFNTPAGQIAGPIETDSGFHIIKVESRLPAVVLPLEQVKERIRPLVLQAKTSDKFAQQVEAWKKTAKIKKNV